MSNELTTAEGSESDDDKDGKNDFGQPHSKSSEMIKIGRDSKNFIEICQIDISIRHNNCDDRKHGQKLSPKA